MIVKHMFWLTNAKTLQVRFLFVGLWNTIFGLILFLLLLEVFTSLNYSILLIISFLISSAQSHFTQRRLVWRSNTNYLREFLRYFGWTSGIFLINLLLLPFLVEGLNWPIYPSQIFMVICLTILGFFFQKYHIFVLK